MRNRSDKRIAGNFPNLLLEVPALFAVSASFISLLLRYRFLPEQIPDLFWSGSNTVSKNYLLYLFALQVVSYLLLTLFQIHPEWRMYSSKLLPILKEEKARKALYRFSTFSLLAVKTEALLTLSAIVIGTNLGKNVTGLVLVMLAVMLFTLIFFETDMPKQHA